jgi:DNA helicase-2/ATP-dependent DNA helicase PcrA
MTPSKYQDAIYDWVSTGRGDAVVTAVAGSGKTTTLVEVSKRLGTSNATFLAFNVAIVKELQARLGEGVVCKTLNALGHSAIGFGLGRNVKITLDDSKYSGLIENELRALIPFPEEVKLAIRPMRNLLSVVMSNLADPSDIEAVRALEAHHGIELPAGLDDRTITSVLTRALRTGEAMGRKGVISYEDQIYLPIKFNWRPRTSQFVLVDEAQDLSPAKLSLALMSRAPGGRMLFVGDPHQAIYGFAGASHDSIDNIIARTNATVLPLSVCYRCPTSVIDEAKKIVPHLEAAPGAPLGEVTQVDPANLVTLVHTGDLIVCRKNAPLVRECVKFIRARMPARVRGRDIGKSLVTLAKTALGGAATHRHARSLGHRARTHHEDRGCFART